MCFHCSRVREQFASHHFSRHLPLHKWRCEAFVQLLCEQNPFHEAPDSQFIWCCCFRKQFGKMRTVLIHSLASFCGFVWSTILCLSCHCSWFMAGQSTLLISVLPDGNAIAMQCFQFMHQWKILVSSMVIRHYPAAIVTAQLYRAKRYDDICNITKFSRCAKWQVKYWEWLLLSEIGHFCWATLINTVKHPIINQALQLSGPDLVGQTFYELAMLTSFDSITFKVTDLFMTLWRFLGN